MYFKLYFLHSPQTPFTMLAMLQNTIFLILKSHIFTLYLEFNTEVQVTLSSISNKSRISVTYCIFLQKSFTNVKNKLQTRNHSNSAQRPPHDTHLATLSFQIKSTRRPFIPRNVSETPSFHSCCPVRAVGWVFSLRWLVLFCLITTSLTQVLWCRYLQYIYSVDIMQNIIIWIIRAGNNFLKFNSEPEKINDQLILLIFI